VPGAEFTLASGINDSGQIVGTFIDASFMNQAFLRDTAGSFAQIDVPGAFFRTEANGINDSGQIVGTFFDATGLHGFLRDTDGSFTPIDVPGALAGVFGINDNGQIVGIFDDSTGTHGFLASPVTPVAEPSTLLLLGAGGLAWWCARGGRFGRLACRTRALAFALFSTRPIGP
jgi:probable HAF family extracellular repeat protein